MRPCVNPGGTVSSSKIIYYNSNHNLIIINNLREQKILIPVLEISSFGKFKTELGKLPGRNGIYDAFPLVASVGGAGALFRDIEFFAVAPAP